MEQIINNLPRDILKEIFSYLFPYWSKIKFTQCYDPESNYSDRYYLCYLEDGFELMNEYNLFFSRIPKKKNKFRYYITQKISTIICELCGGKCRSMNYCRGNTYNENRYT